VEFSSLNSNSTDKPAPPQPQANSMRIEMDHSISSIDSDTPPNKNNKSHNSLMGMLEQDSN
jgi:hypothetical protein